MIGIESIEDSNSYPPITPIAGYVGLEHQVRFEFLSIFPLFFLLLIYYWFWLDHWNLTSRIHQYRGEPAHIRVGSTNMTRSSGRRLPRRRASPPATDLATMVEDICSCFSTSVSMFSWEYRRTEEDEPRVESEAEGVPQLALLDRVRIMEDNQTQIFMVRLERNDCLDTRSWNSLLKKKRLLAFTVLFKDWFVVPCVFDSCVYLVYRNNN